MTPTEQKIEKFHNIVGADISYRFEKQITDAVMELAEMLEHRFLRSLGCTPAAEIRRTRLEFCKRMLLESDLPIAAIAAQSGFNHPEVMIRAFQRELGVTPSQFRRSR